MIPMYKIAVMGDRDSVLGFQALGLEVWYVNDPEEARRRLRRLVGENCAILYITETLAQTLQSDIARLRETMMPAIIIIPGKNGSLGLADAELQSAVERAVGADIS